MRKLVFLAVPALAALIWGCTPEGQRPIASGEAAAARLATAQRAFVPPPRSVSDVIARLEREIAARRPPAAPVDGNDTGEIVDAEAVPAAPQGPAATPRAQTPGPGGQGPRPPQAQPGPQTPQARPAAPAAVSDSERGELLRRSAEARARASRLRAEGRIDEHLAASREALELARRAQPQDLFRYIETAARAELAFGARSRGVDLMVEAANASQGPVVSLMLAAETARELARVGRREDAARQLARAEDFRRQAQAMRNATPYFEMYAAHLNYSKGVVAWNAGQLPQAERDIRAALADMETMHGRARGGLGTDPNRFVDLVGLYRADLAQVLNAQQRFVEAEVFARQALALSLDARGPYHITTVFRIRPMVETLIEQGRFAEAEKLAALSLAILREMKVVPTTGSYLAANSQLATALLWQGKYDAALAEYRRMLQAIGNNRGLAERQVTATRNYGVALLMTGDSRAAQAVLDRVARDQLERFGPEAHGPAVVRGFRALAAARNGAAPRAVAELREIAPVLERGPAGDAASSDASGAAINRIRRVLIEELVGLHAGLAARGDANAVGEAFRLADLARGMSVQGAIAQMSARAGAGDPALEEAIRREQDIAQQVTAMRGILAEAAGQSADQRDARVETQLRRQADTLDAERKRLGEDIARRFPGYEQLRNPRPPSMADAVAALKPDEALVSFFVGREASYVWALRPGQAPRFAAVPMGDAALAREVAALREALDPNAATLDEIPAFDAARAHRLYAALLGPVEAAFAGARAISIVPHGALGQLPLAVLVTKPPPSLAARPGQPYFVQYRDVAWLVRDVAVSQVPSVAALRTLRALPAPAAQRREFAGFGDPQFSAQQTAAAAEPAQLATRGARLVRRNAPAVSNAASVGLADLPPLPDTADEVLSVARALGADPARDVFLGAQASERSVRGAELARRRFVMFATHGLVPGELDGLTQPALALAAPSAADANDDGLLTMEEVLRLRLDADWVVLSACNTAAGNGEGAEAISGLGRAFFYAGARALLVTSWPVETTSARLLTTDVFARQTRDPRLDRATALRQSMLALIGGTAEGGAFAYAHPIFWAPFLLVGDGG